ncbi:hypothetical protein AZE42_11594 [Rhizopogon vesiculosus]|uniref:Zn(2)-C6 fungal-type domain-containing protein n=1 Tax=Rhizopogon vesiculosus TaxID=180088 RepID=A0A1J8QY52_9AGAM|nr:hypothetical protein AZE42_11594 [Rhizopogon vesiculosus]
MTTSEPSNSPSSQSLSALQRGKACIACRRRKVRCDGVRPTCGQCIRGHRPEDCEYTDGHVKSRTHMLEEDIVRLQTRVQELEHPEHTIPAVALHNPYSLPGVSQESSAQIDLQRVYPPSSISPASSHGVPDEPPRHIVLESLNKIIPYADELGLFLHVPRVRASLETTSGHDIPLALQNALILISLHITETQQQSAYEMTLLSTSSRQLTDIIPFCGASTRDLLHVIQTEILLELYLFRVGRTVEARYHLGAAASLALAFRLHSSSPADDERHIPADMQSMLFDIFRTPFPHPVDQIERTEGIHAFWIIFTRDKCRSAILGIPPSISGSVRITVPWPGRIQEVNFSDQDIHFMNSQLEDRAQADTIKQFLDGASSDEGDTSSTLALFAKAIVLFDKANNLVEQYTSDPRIQQMPSFRKEFALLDALTERLQASIPYNSFTTSSSFQLDRTPSPPHVVPRYAISIQSVLSLAVIRLHSPFHESYAPSNAKCVAAAMRIARALQGMNFNTLQFVDPVIVIWINASFVIHAEITRLRSLKANWAIQFADRDEEEFVQALKIVLDILRDMVDHCPVHILRRKLEAVLPLLEYLGPTQYLAPGYNPS